MIEILALGLFVSPFFAKAFADEFQEIGKHNARTAAYKAPGLSSQASQIQPVAPSTKAYLGPKRPRSAEFYRNRRTKKAVRKLPF